MHWAAYSCAEISANYLLAWSPNLNLTDELGQTALHTAVKRINDAESVRGLRFLLLKGAKKDVRDSNGRTASDYCGQIENDKLRSEAILMLEKPRLLDCLVLTPPTRKMKRNWNTMVVFLLMYVFTISVQVFMTFPHLPTWSIMLNLVITAVSLVCLVISTVKQPGRLKPQTINFMTMLATLDCT